MLTLPLTGALRLAGLELNATQRGFGLDCHQWYAVGCLVKGTTEL